MYFFSSAASPLSTAFCSKEIQSRFGFIGEKLPAKLHESPEQSTLRGGLRGATWIRSPVASQIAVAIRRPNGFTWWPFIHGADISRSYILAGVHSTERRLADFSILPAPGYGAGQKIIQQPFFPYMLWLCYSVWGKPHDCLGFILLHTSYLLWMGVNNNSELVS